MIKRFFFLSIIALSVVANAQTTKAPNNVDALKQRYMFVYDPGVLRIQGKALPIGIMSISKAGVTETKGLLKGKDGWTKYAIEVTGGTFKGGNIIIGGTNAWKKNDSITVNVYSRKWFLGKKDKLLFTQKIAYNYETGIKIMTMGNYSKIPGVHITFGIRTFYDNKMFDDKWAPAYKNMQDFQFSSSGSHISKTKGDLKIDTDPGKISNDKIRLIARLAKDSLLSDTLQVTLDYAAKYECVIKSTNTGHKLNVTASTYNDSIIHTKLIKVSIYDSIGEKTYNYVLNTVGGSIMISSQGADGHAGTPGLDGSSGSDGADGDITTTDETVTNADGSTSTNTTSSQGPGGNGDNGGDGGNGGKGGNGYNGGNITIKYTPETKPYLNLLTAYSIAGAGGQGGMGGQGGQGGNGGNGSPSGLSGNSGSDGIAGPNGKDGVKGSIVYTPAK